MRLKTYLETADELDSAFASRIGVTKQAVSRYKLGQRKPKWQILERISAATQGAVTPNDFIDLPPHPPAPAEAAP